MKQNYRMVTISIDPEHDTPETLQQFAARFKAESHWYLLTGSKESVRKVLKAFEAHYPGNNKMYHQPYTYLRARHGTPWLKLDGLLSSADLVAEYRALLAQHTVFRRARP